MAAATAAPAAAAFDDPWGDAPAATPAAGASAPRGLPAPNGRSAANGLRTADGAAAGAAAGAGAEPFLPRGGPGHARTASEHDGKWARGHGLGARARG